MNILDIRVSKDNERLHVKTEAEGYYLIYYAVSVLKKLVDEACAENDTRVGRIQRELEAERDMNQKRKMWLRKQKERSGVYESTSFDEVWEQALQALLYCRKNKIDYRQPAETNDNAQQIYQE